MHARKDRPLSAITTNIAIKRLDPYHIWSSSERLPAPGMAY